MAQYKVIDFDIIYLSYDEPNAEENYANLLTKVPWAKRIHGRRILCPHKLVEISRQKDSLSQVIIQIDEQFPIPSS